MMIFVSLKEENAFEAKKCVAGSNSLQEAPEKLSV